MAYTYQDYLNEQSATTEPEKQTYKYSDFMADQEKEDAPIREWLKSQGGVGLTPVGFRENVEITPEVRKRFEQYSTRPGIKPEDVDTKLTGGEKFAKVVGPAVAQTARFGGKVAEYGNELYGLGGLIAEGLGNMASPGRIEPNQIAEYLYKLKNEGRDVAPQIAEQSLEFAGTPAEKFVQNLGAGAFGAGIKLPMYHMLGLPATMGLEKAAETRSSGGSMGETIESGVAGGIEGAGTHGALGLIGGLVPGKVLPRAVAFGGAGTETLLRGGTPEQALESAIIMASLTKGRGKEPITAKGQRIAREEAIDKTNEITWREEQRKIQRAQTEKNLDTDIIKSMEENLNRPKVEITTKKQLAEEMPPEVGREQSTKTASIEEGNRGEGWSYNSRTGEMAHIATGGDFPTGKGIVNSRQSMETGEYEVDASSDPNVFSRMSKESFLDKVKKAKQTPEEAAIPEYSTAEPPAKPTEPVLPVQTKEPELPPNQHSTKVVDKAKEITENSGELSEIYREWEKPVAQHLRMNLDEQAIAARSVQANPELAREVATIGLEAFSKRKIPVPVAADGHPLKAEAVWVAEKNKAIANKDVDYLLELAKNSPVQEQISQAGKSLVLLRNRNPQDPVYQIIEINKEAKNTLETGLGNKKVKEASDRRVIELERQILDKTKKIEQLENRKAIENFKYEARKRGRVRTKEELSFEFDDLAKELNRQFSSQANIGLDPKILKLMGRMAVNRVESGMKTIEQVVDDIYVALGNKVDKRLIRDGITGYGKTAKLSKDQIDKDLREVKRQGRLVSMLEDAEGGIAPLRTGLQRDKPSARVKDLRQQVEDAMRKNGLIIEKTAKSPEEQQLTAIQKYKNYLIKRHAELSKKLIDGDYEVKPRKKTEVDSKLQAAKENVDRLSKTHRSLKEINQLRETGITREEATKLVELSNITTEKKGVVTDWNDRSANGPALEYGRSLVEFFNEANGLKQRARKLTGKEILSKAIHEPLKSLGRGLSVTSGVSKSILASMDNSALGRQGIKMMWSHPTIWFKNAKQSWVDMAKQFGGKEVLNEVMADVLSRPNAVDGIYGKMKLDVGNVEEAYPSQFPEKIPFFRRPYKASEVAFMGFQYRNRADAADMYLNIAKKMGVDVTDKVQLESIGNLVNTLTGRGKLGKSMERMSGPLNNVFFAPKFFKSNWDFLTGHMFVSDTPFVRKQAGINLMKYVAGTAAALGVAKMLGADIELDPRSADFGKIRIGSTRFDVTGGVAAVATLATRLLIGLSSGVGQVFGGKPLMATKSSTTGKLTPLTSGKPFTRNTIDVLTDAIEGKLAPLAGLIKNIGRGVDNNRKPLTLDSILLSGLLPIGIQNIIQDLPNKDRVPIVASWLADFVGIGSSTYGKKKKKRIEWKI